MDLNKNHGVILESKPEDWHIAGETGITPTINLPDGNWEPYLPTNEVQYHQIGVFFDTSACVSFSANNCIETKLNFLIDKIPVSKIQEMKDLGYIDVNGKFNFSDRFLAKMSGTTTNGNTFQKVWDTIRKYGLVGEQDWPFVSTSFDDYYKEIPQEIKDKAPKFLDYIDVKYEFIALENLSDALKQSPVQICSPTCPDWNTGVVTSCGLTQPTHATMLFKEDSVYHDFDHYSPFEKTLSADYHINALLKSDVTLKVPPPPPAPYHHTFTKDMARDRFNDPLEVYALQEALKILGYFKLVPIGLFGPRTEEAVIALQNDHVAEILTPAGLTKGSGRCLTFTRKFLNDRFSA